MNLNGEYTCLVSSLDGQDSRSASLVVYQPPRSFAFEHRIFPAPAVPLPAPPAPPPVPVGGGGGGGGVRDEVRASGRPTQFRSLAPLVRPPNNLVGGNGSQVQVQVEGAPTRVVYTHDGRPVLRRSRSAPATWPRWKQPPPAESPDHFAIQLHHFQCQATQVTPRPVIRLTVKRNAEAIAQYLHEASSTSLRPFQVSQAQYFGDESTAAAANSSGNLVTLYDITVSATVALNVTLPSPGPTSGDRWSDAEQSSSGSGQNEQSAVNTVLHFRRGQRMSFECHLELTGTEFEQRRRIAISEDGEYRLPTCLARSWG